ncbi:MAG: 4Fe-4S dicluster domain-containing protein [Phycisphaerae bacterium]|nr:4Fe-4S dicluster domain-containing protein [Phycisphaerae bacterium]
MAVSIFIKGERCKGCGLCVSCCPKGALTMSKTTNSKGYFVAEHNGRECSGCACCAIMCPDAAIEITKTNVEGVEHKKKTLTKEKVRG